MNFLITALAVYGISSLITQYDGPFNGFCRLRDRFPSSALHCVVCVSVWLTVPIVLAGVYAGVAFIAPLAIVGFIILLENL